MKTLRIRISRVIDHGTIVSLVGIDSETGEPVTIHVDHRPFATFWEAWREAGFPQRIEYEADQLMLHLDLLPANGGEVARLVERDNLGTPASNDQHAQEIEQ